MRIRLKQGISIWLSILVIVSAATFTGDALEQSGENGISGSDFSENDRLTASIFDNQDTADYSEYREQWTQAATPEETITLPGDASVKETASKAGVLDGSACTVIPEGSGALWSFFVPSEGLYEITVEYYALPGKGRDIEAVLSVDGALPYRELSQLSFPRIWQDANAITADRQGNQLRPGQKEVFRWNAVTLRDKDGYYEHPFKLFFTSGNHQIRIGCKIEGFAVRKISIGNKPPLPSYASVQKDYENRGVPLAPAFQKIYQAEKALEKSSSMLYPTSDRTSAATQPSHHYKLCLNTIGQNTWKYVGQWISWEIEAPHDGLYQLGFKVRQNYSQGLNSYRTLYIDGEIPFKEAENITFRYDLNWYIRTLGDEKHAGLVYLTKGRHEIRMEAVAGPTAELLKGLSDTVLMLNDIYRSIIVITGTTPDLYRTFNLEKEIPDLIPRLEIVNSRMEALSSSVKQLIGADGSEASIIDQVIFLLKAYVEDPLQIPARLSSFRDNISSLGALIQLMREQPLEMDYFVLSSQTAMPKAKAGFWQRLKFVAGSFFASFFNDYNSIGNASGSGGNGVSVWIHGGRDQAQVLRAMIDDLFTAKTGIPVNLSLVEAGSTVLMQATLAGKGPDIALGVTQELPVNLAMRGALVDLSAMENFQQIESRFYPSAWVSYRYQGGVYAIPETQIFDMLFYRSDILEQLGLKPPKTWPEFYSAVEVLQRNNLYAGIPETDAENPGVSSGIGTFAKLLYQNGGSFYNKELTETAFNTKTAYDAFTEWTDLYRLYGLERQFNFYSMFRSGEMPLAIQPYTMYNMLTQAAPEIRGLWDFTSVPGTVKEDGTIDITEISSGTACVMMRTAANQRDAFSFLEWWTSSDIQARYGNELESILGPSARYNTANTEAFRQLPWSSGEIQKLTAQWDAVVNVPQIPGSYYVSRCLTNALRTVISRNANPVNTLNKYAKEINAELERKSKEFGLNT